MTFLDLRSKRRNAVNAMNAAYKPRDVYAEAVTHMRVCEDRDSARRAAKWLGAIAVVLTLLLLYVCSLPAPAVPVCPANVMALDPLTIRANGAPVVEI